MKSSRAMPALVFRCFGLILGLSGIIFHHFSNSFFKNGFMVKHNLAYFTLQTNIFCTVIFALLVFRSLRELRRGRYQRPAELNHSLKSACTFYICLTMLGFWLVLAPMTGINMQPFLLADTMLLHTVNPLMAILDQLLFCSHGGLKSRDAAKWMLYPVCYLASVFIIAAFIKEPYYSFSLAGRTVELMYPYPFLDPQVMGAAGVAAVCGALAIIFTLLALLFIAADNKLIHLRAK